jgi:hypothetical protein
MPGNGGTWTEAESPYGANTYEERYFRCNPEGAACQLEAMQGAPAAADVGHTIRLEVIATNEGGSTSAISAPSSVVIGRGAIVNEIDLPSTSEPTQLAAGQAAVAWLDAPEGLVGVWVGEPGAGPYHGQPGELLEPRETGVGSALDAVTYTQTRAYFTADDAEGYGEVGVDPDLGWGPWEPIWHPESFGVPTSIYSGKPTSRHFLWVTAEGSNDIFVRDLGVAEDVWKEIEVPGADGYLTDIIPEAPAEAQTESVAFIDTACAHVPGASCFVGTANAGTGKVTETTVPAVPRDVAISKDHRTFWVTSDQPTSEILACPIGGSCTEYPLPAGSRPGQIVEGADRPVPRVAADSYNAWFIEEGSDAVDSINAQGVYPAISLPPGSEPVGIATNGGGIPSQDLLWITERGAKKLISMAP